MRIPAPARARSLIAPAYALVLALLVTAPLLAPGYLLLRDAVATPRSYLSDSALGLSEAAPRALPQDFVVALATGLVDGGLVVKMLLVTGLFLAGWGAARLAATVVPDAGVAGQFVAVTMLEPFGVSKTNAIAYIFLFQAMNYAVVLFWGLLGIAAERQRPASVSPAMVTTPQTESD